MTVKAASGQGFAAGTLDRSSGPLRVHALAFLGRYGIYLFFVGFLLLAGLLAPSFFSRSNLSNLILQIVPLAIVGCGQALVILVRGLDLSVSSVMATAAVAATSFSGHNADVLPIVLVALAIGVMTGLLNGFLVVKRNVSPFLATLATMIVLQGLRFGWTHGAPSGLMPPLLRVIGSGTWSFVPVNLLVLVAVALPLAAVLHKTAVGRRIMITGGNPLTGRLLGYRTDVLIIGAYVVCSMLAAVAGLVLGGYAQIVDNWVGKGFELDSIVAAVLGGFALSGGRGTIGGALAGSAVLVLASNIVLLIGLPIQFQIILKGLVIVSAAACYAKR
jgi:ribose/xylose/arabinose/galactoside ABC-type transport system permease subunit